MTSHWIQNKHFKFLTRSINSEMILFMPISYYRASVIAQLVKNPPVMQNWVQSLGWEDLLEKGKATHSSILTWRIPWTVQTMGTQRLGQDFHFHFSPHIMLIPPLFPNSQPHCILPSNVPPSSAVVFMYTIHLRMLFLPLAWLTPIILDILFKYQFIRNSPSPAQIPIIFTLSTLVFFSYHNLKLYISRMVSFLISV